MSKNISRGLSAITDALCNIFHSICCHYKMRLLQQNFIVWMHAMTIKIYPSIYQNIKMLFSSICSTPLQHIHISTLLYLACPLTWLILQKTRPLKAWHQGHFFYLSYFLPSLYSFYSVFAARTSLQLILSPADSLTELLTCSLPWVLRL